MTKPAPRSPKAGKANGSAPDARSDVASKADAEKKAAEHKAAIDRIFMSATGAETPDVAQMMVNQVANTIARDDRRSERESRDLGFNMVSQMIAYRPKGVLEGMLVAQMVSTHNAVMDCLYRAQTRSDEARDVNLKHAEKLQAIFAKQIETLDKHRNRGQQRITVEHVTVNAGGKAIIGDVGVGGEAAARAAPSEPLALANDPGELAPVIDQVERQAPEPVAARKVSRGG